MADLFSQQPPEPQPPTAAQAESLSVSQLTQHIRGLLEADALLQRLSVKGELSGFKKHGSGHWYFTLKDEQSQVQGVMYRGAAQLNPWQNLRDGEQVEVQGRITVYAGRGQYQLVAERITPSGLGDLYLQFLALKEKLAAEGLFEPGRKRSLPPLPRHVALITSPTGAVVQDVLRTLRRRQAPLTVTVIPSAVQGPEAVPALVRGIAQAQQTQGVEVIIIARGGGSLEDLWAFNEEAVVRALAASRVPTLSAVGHETDFTLADFAADVRASTPTAAAELVCPAGADLWDFLARTAQELDRYYRRRLDHERQWLDDAAGQLALRVRYQQQRRAQLLQSARGALQQQLALHMARQRGHLHQLSQALSHLDPQAVLARGYAMVTKSGLRITRSAQLSTHDALQLRMQDGSRAVEVKD